jgi:hypothetical protein
MCITERDVEPARSLSEKSRKEQGSCMCLAGQSDEEQGIPAYRSSDSRARGILEAHDFSLSPSAPDHLSPEYSLIKPGTIMGKIHVLDNEISI